MYDFDRIIDRYGTNSMKWDRQPRRFGLTRAWSYGMADMDFAVMPEITEAICQRTRHPVYGYTAPDDQFLTNVAGWMKRRHNVELSPEWMIVGEGVVSSLVFGIEAFTEPGDGVLVFNPVYDQFFTIIEGQNRHVVACDLIRTSEGYRMDMEQAELLASEAKLAIICNPHNPIGRVWSRDELLDVTALCKKHHLIMLSDEIHGDITFDDHSYTPLISLDEAKDIAVSIVSPNKTFNISGLGVSVTVVPDHLLRDRYAKAFRAHFVFGSNLFAYAAASAAYTKGDQWVDELCSYLKENVRYVEQTLQSEMPEISLLPPEGTYLIWLNISALKLSSKDVCTWMAKECKVILSPGESYRGEKCDEFVRINVACPRSCLEPVLNALRRLCKTRRRLESKQEDAKILAVILTGGDSNRMRSDKALLELNGNCFSMLLAQRYKHELGDAVFAVDHAGRFPCGEFQELPDTFPGKGPMNGLYSAFTKTDAELVLLTATDIPNGSPTLAKKLREYLLDQDICLIRRTDGGFEPLFGLYRKSCLSSVSECLHSGHYSLQELFSRMKVRYVDESELKEWDLPFVLQNINTPEEYDAFIQEHSRQMMQDGA